MMKVELRIYEGIKYEATEEMVRVQYDITGFEVTDGKGAEIEKTDGSCIDEYDEYLILHLADGDTATFRNSHVDMFRA